MKYDIRGSLLAKIIAIALLITTSAGAALGTCGMILRAQGYGMTGGGDFYQDALFMIPLNDAMEEALYYVTEPDSDFPWQYRYRLDRYYQGFACAIYEGEASKDNLVGTWSEITNEHTLYHTKKVETILTDVGYFTVQGYLTEPLPYGSSFWLSKEIHDMLQPFQRSNNLMALTALQYLTALAALIFLLCAAGHRRDEKYVLPNRQDRIPLDLYL